MSYYELCHAETSVMNKFKHMFSYTFTFPLVYMYVSTYAIDLFKHTVSYKRI